LLRDATEEGCKAEDKVQAEAEVQLNIEHSTLSIIPQYL
jgi:hypothetical protein